MIGVGAGVVVQQVLGTCLSRVAAARAMPYAARAAVSTALVVVVVVVVLMNLLLLVAININIIFTIIIIIDHKIIKIIKVKVLLLGMVLHATLLQLLVS